MGRSHALAYHKLPGFQIVGLVTRSADSRAKLNAELGGGYAEYGDFHAALKAVLNRLNGVIKTQSTCKVLLGSPAKLGVDDTFLGKI